MAIFVLKKKKLSSLFVMTSPDITELLIHQASVDSLRREFEEAWCRAGCSTSDNIDHRDSCWREFLAERLELAERAARTN